MLFKLKVLALFKFVVKSIAYLTASVILFVLSFILFEPLRIALVSTLAHHSVQIIDQNLTINELDIEQLSWSEVHIKSLQLDDANNTWFSLDNFYLSFNLSALLEKQVKINQFKVEKIELIHLPQWIELESLSQSKDEKNKETTQEEDRLEEIVLPVKLNLDEFNFSKISIKEQAYEQLLQAFKLKSSVDEAFESPWSQLIFSLRADAKIQHIDDIQANIIFLLLTPNSLELEEKEKTLGIKLNLETLASHSAIGFELQLNQLAHQIVYANQLNLTGQIQHSKKEKIQFTTSGRADGLSISSLADHFKKPQNLNWQAEGELFEQNLRLESFQFSTPWLKNFVKGKVNLEDLDGQFIIKNTLADLSLLKEHLTTEAIGQLNFSKEKTSSIEFRHSLSLSNQAKYLSIKTQGLVNQLAFKDQQLNQYYQSLIGSELELNANIDFANFNKLTINSLALDALETSLSAHGNLDLNTSQIDMTVEHVIDDLSVINDADGIVEQKIKISGVISSPKVELTSNIEQAKWQNYRFEQIELITELIDLKKPDLNHLSLNLSQDKHQFNISSEYQLVDNILSLSGFSLTAENSGNKHTGFEGSIKLNTKTSLINGQISGQSEELQELAYLHQQGELSGAFDFELELSSIEAQQAVSLSLVSPQLSYQQWQTEGLYLQLDLLQDKNIQGKLKLQSLSESKQKRLQNGLVTVDGDFKLFQSKIQAKNLWDIKNLDGRSKLLTSKNENQPNKSYEFVFNHLTGQYQNDAFKLQSPLIVNFQDENNWSLQAEKWSWGSAGFDLNAIAKQKKIDAGIAITAFDLSNLQVLDQYVDELSEVEGMIDLNMSVSGALDKPKLNVNVKAANIKLNQQVQEVMDKNHLELSIDYNQQKLTGKLNGQGFSSKSAAEQQQVLIPLKATFDLPINLSLKPFVLTGVNSKLAETPLNAHFATDLRISQLHNWLILDQQILDGYLSTELDIQGPISHPELNGEIMLSEGYYENGFTGTIVNNIHGQIEIDNNHIQILSLNAQDSEQGSIHLSGQANLRNLEQLDYDAKLTISEFKFLNTDEQQLKSSGQLVINGNKQAASLTGELIVDSGEFFLPKEIPADVPVLEITEDTTEGNTKEKEAKDVIYPVDFDLNVQVKPQLYVRGRGLESQWTGGLTIKGKLPEPEVLGQLSVKRGTIDFLTKQFSFRHGYINFYGGWPVKPQLNFEFEATANDLTAVLKLSGDSKKIVFGLSSEPLLPDDEILSQLLFGKDKQSISAVQALQLVIAIRSLTSGGSGFMDNTRQQLGFDTLDVGGGSEGESSSLKAGKHINDRVYMEVEQDLSSGGSSVKVEIEMKKNISVESRIDQDSSTGIGINWKKDY